MPWEQRPDGWYYIEYHTNQWGNQDSESQGPYPQPNASGAPPTGGVYAWQSGAPQDPPQQSSAAVQPAQQPAAQQPLSTVAESPPIGTAPPPGTGLTSVQQSAKASIESFLANYGLSALGDFAWNEYLQGVPIEQITLDIRSRPEYKARFPAMEALAQKGHAINESQYVQYERDASQILTYAGLGQFSTPAYLSSLIANEVSIAEVTDRVQNGYSRVVEAPPEVRAQFAEWFGANGDAALAGWFLDASHTEPFIKDAVDTAQAGGYGKFFGFNNMTQQGAHLIGQIAKTPGALISGFQKAATYKPLTYETIGERTDLTQDQTVEAAFGTGGDAQEAFRHRLEERVASGTGGGGALQSAKGLSGVGTAQQ